MLQCMRSKTISAKKKRNNKRKNTVKHRPRPTDTTCTKRTEAGHSQFKRCSFANSNISSDLTSGSTFDLTAQNLGSQLVDRGSCQNERKPLL